MKPSEASGLIDHLWPLFARLLSRRLSTVALAAALAVALVGVLAPVRLPAFAAAAAKTAPPRDDLTYVGSGVCQSCHTQLYANLGRTGHANVLTASGLPADRTGCEACHGPGSEHVGGAGKKPITESLAGADAERAEEVCGRCHLQQAGLAGALTIEPKHWRRTRHARERISCLSCHSIHGSVERSLKRTRTQLCLECHQAVVNQNGQYTHRPVEDGQCLLCHLPHGGPVKHDLVDHVSGACLSCHPATGQKLSATHGGYAIEEANCLSCHNPHSFDRGASLLRKTQHSPFAAGKCLVCHRSSPSGAPELAKSLKETCLACHSEQKVMPASDSEGHPLTQHPPVTQGLCTTCHDPHAADHPKLMKDRTDYTCVRCHGAIEQAGISEHRHQPVESGNCLLCHKGHVSTEDDLLIKQSIPLCEGCHVTQGKFTHPVGVRKGVPIRDPNTKQVITCARCHAVHGSDFVALLPQDEDTLCRGCHKK